jgi:hypothetical protein
LINVQQAKIDELAEQLKLAQHHTSEISVLGSSQNADPASPSSSSSTTSNSPVDLTSPRSLIKQLVGGPVMTVDVSSSSPPVSVVPLCSPIKEEETKAELVEEEPVVSVGDDEEVASESNTMKSEDVPPTPSSPSPLSLPSAVVEPDQPASSTTKATTSPSRFNSFYRLFTLISLFLYAFIAIVVAAEVTAPHNITTQLIQITSDSLVTVQSPCPASLMSMNSEQHHLQ